jgi:hypothetical protein
MRVRFLALVGSSGRNWTLHMWREPLGLPRPESSGRIAPKHEFFRKAADRRDARGLKE